jgi:4-amino-4-deoxy-L-arabinose transferase-like glycosyltransferase
MASGRGYPPMRVHRHHHVRVYADAYRPPLWPAVLGAVYALAGHRPTAGRYAGALLGALGTLALAWIALRLLGRRAMWWSSTIGAVYLPLALVSGVLVSETLFVLLELLALGLALEVRRGRYPLLLAGAAGAVVGLAALTRLNGVIVLTAVLPLVAVPRRRLAGPALALTACVLVIAPWTIRNAVELHAFVPVSTESGPTLAGTYNLRAMHDRAAPGAWLLLRYTEYARLARRQLAPAAEDALLRRAAVRFITSHPAYPFTVAAHNLQRWLGLGGASRARFEAHTADIGPGWANAALPFAWALGGLALLGIATRAARGTPRAFWLAPLLLLISTLLVNAETPRFRAALDPFLILLAAASLASIPRARSLSARLTSTRSSHSASPT